MYVESNDKEGAKVYEMIIKQIFQDLVLSKSVEDLRAYVNPDEVLFILAIKMRKTSQHILLNEVADVKYDKEEDTTTVLIDNENFLPNILRSLWKEKGRENVNQPSRYVIVLEGKHEIANLIIDDPYKNLKKRIYDGVFRIIPEGFKIIKDISRDDVIAIVATDELIKDEWVDKAEEYIKDLNTPKIY